MIDSNTIDFVSKQSILTFGVASVIVTAVTNTVRKLLRLDSAWVGFIASVLVVLGGSMVNQQLRSGSDWFLGVINSFLLFCAAAGLTEVAAGAGPRPTTDVVAHGARQVKFFQSWFKSAD